MLDNILFAFCFESFITLNKIKRHDLSDSETLEGQIGDLVISIISNSSFRKISSLSVNILSDI